MPDWPDGVSAQRFDSTGNKLGTELQVNTYTVGVQGFPAVTGDRDSFVITWMSDGEDGRFGIFGQRYFNEACPESTASDCVAASRSAVVMKSSAGAQSFGRLSWRWATDPPLESRSPVSPSHYLLCLYDGSGLVSEIRIDGSCNAAFCGSVSANASGRLRSRFSTDSRQTRRRSADGLSRVLLRVGGTGLSLPPFPLNDSAPVLVQLHPSAGLPCLEAGYTGPALRNDLNEYRNRIP